MPLGYLHLRLGRLRRFRHRGEGRLALRLDEARRHDELCRVVGGDRKFYDLVGQAMKEKNPSSGLGVHGMKTEIIGFSTAGRPRRSRSGPTKRRRSTSCP